MEEQNGAKISIIVPVYNTEAYLPACLESLLRQTHRNLELLTVDDGSTDGSAAILEAYAKRDPRIRVIRQKNGGVSSARNAGIDAATGAYIGFVDSDDTVEPTYCETLLRGFAEHPEIGVSICGRTILGHPNGRTTGGTEGAGTVLSARDAMLCAVSLGRSFEGYLWNKLFDAKLFRETENGGFRFRLDPEISVCEDLLLCAKIFAEGQCAYFDPTPLYRYHYRKTGALNTFGEGRLSEFRARDQVEKIAASFDETVLHTAQLSHAKSALNLLAAAKERHDPQFAAAMKREVDRKIRVLLRAKDLPRKERVKLLIRRAFPVIGMRLYLATRRKES